MAHWYLEDGSPYHFLEDGRSVTLREARKKCAVPSVTTILSSLSKPGLEYWIQDQLLNEALDNMYAFLARGMTYEEAKSEIRKGVKEASDSRMALGTRIHSGIEDCFYDRPVDDDIRRLHFELLKALNQLLSCEPVWAPEQRFSDARGFGGAVDLHCTSPAVVVDWKTTENIPRQARVEHGLQLAAYAAGLNIPNAKLYNVYIDVNNYNFTIREHKNTWWLLEYWFALVDLWKIKNKYDPGAKWKTRK